MTDDELRALLVTIRELALRPWLPAHAEYALADLEAEGAL